MHKKLRKNFFVFLTLVLVMGGTFFLVVPNSFVEVTSENELTREKETAPKRAAAAQVELVLSENWGGEFMGDVVVDQNRAFLACYYDGVRVVDFNEEGTEIVSSDIYYCDGEWINKLAIYGNYLYAAGENYVFIFEISSDMVFVNSIMAFDHIYDMKIHGGYLYIVHMNGGIRIYDLWDPVYPSSQHLFSEEEWVTEINFQGDYVWMKKSDDLMCYPLIENGNIGESMITSLGFAVLDWEISNNRLYIFDYDDTMYLYDISDPFDMSLDHSHFVSGIFTPARMAVSGNWLFIGDNGNNLTMIDYTLYTEPEIYQMYAPQAHKLLAPGDGRLLFAGSNEGLTIVRYGSFTGFVEVGRIEGPQEMNQVLVHNDIIFSYGQDAEEVQAWRHDDLVGYQLIGTSDLVGTNQVWAVENSGALSASAQGDEGVVFHDLSDPTNIARIGNWDDGWFCRDVAFLGSNLLIAAGYKGNDHGLVLLNISDPSDAQLIVDYRVFGETHRNVEISGNYAYSALGEGGIAAYSITNQSISLMDTYPGIFYDLCAKGSRIYAGGLGSVVSVRFNETHGFYDAEFTETVEPGAIVNVDSRGNTLLLSSWFSPQIYQLSPTAPVPVQTASLGSYLVSCTLDGEYIYIPQGSAGLTIIKWHDNQINSPAPVVDVAVEIADDGCQEIQVTWTPLPDVDSYRIYIQNEPFDSLIKSTYEEVSGEVMEALILFESLGTQFINVVGVNGTGQSIFGTPALISAEADPNEGPTLILDGIIDNRAIFTVDSDIICYTDIMFYVASSEGDFVLNEEEGRFTFTVATETGAPNQYSINIDAYAESVVYVAVRGRDLSESFSNFSNVIELDLTEHTSDNILSDLGQAFSEYYWVILTIAGVALLPLIIKNMKGKKGLRDSKGSASDVGEELFDNLDFDSEF